MSSLRPSGSPEDPSRPFFEEHDSHELRRPVLRNLLARLLGNAASAHYPAPSAGGAESRKGTPGTHAPRP